MATAMQGPTVRPDVAPPAAKVRPGAERLAPLTGVAVLLFGLAGWIVFEGPAGRPEADVRPDS
jgi:hypothetical protein